MHKLRMFYFVLNCLIIISDGRGFILIADREKLHFEGKPFVKAKIQISFHQVPVSLNLNCEIVELLSKAGLFAFLLFPLMSSLFIYYSAKKSFILFEISTQISNQSLCSYRGRVSRLLSKTYDIVIHAIPCRFFFGSKRRTGWPNYQNFNFIGAMMQFLWLDALLRTYPFRTLKRRMMEFRDLDKIYRPKWIFIRN